MEGNKTRGWAKMLEGLYYRLSNFLNAGQEAQTSWTWSSILLGQDILKQNDMKTIEYRESVRLFHNSWIPTLPGRNSQGKQC